MKPHLSVGGTNIGDEVEKIEKLKPNLIIGTVGWIWDLTQRTLNFKHLKVLIIDEADLIIENGNTMKLSSIIDKLPK